MKVMICGCGAVGLGLAAALYDSGVSADLIAKGETLKKIKQDGLKRTGIFKDITVEKENVNVFSSAKETGNNLYDYVIVACKTTASKEVADDLGAVDNLLSSNGKIVLFQNGFGNDLPFLKYFDKKAMYGGIIITGFDRPERNISRVTVHSASAQIGSIYGNPELATDLAELLAQGGQPCVASDHIISDMWSKMLYNCTLNPLGALMNTNYGGLLQCPEGKDLLDKTIEEIFDVMDACCFKTKWSCAEEYKNDFYNNILPPTCNHRSSTLQDIERKNKTEIESLTGVVVRLGKEHNVPTPVNSMIYKLIKVKESLYFYKENQE